MWLSSRTGLLTSSCFPPVRYQEFMDVFERQNEDTFPPDCEYDCPIYSQTPRYHGEINWEIQLKEKITQFQYLHSLKRAISKKMHN